MLTNRIIFLIFISLSLNTMAQIPNIEIQFGGALKKNCSFVSDEDVLSSLSSTLQVLGQIQEVETQCQNILINSKAFVESSLNNIIDHQTKLKTVETNKLILENLIQEQINSQNGYDGDFDEDLLELSQQETLLKDTKYLSKTNFAQTMLLGKAIFEDLTTAPIACSHSFGQDLLAPAVALTGQGFGLSNPLVGAAAGLLQSVINYADRVINPSFRSFKRLTETSNFHMTY